MAITTTARGANKAVAARTTRRAPSKRPKARAQSRTKRAATARAHRNAAPEALIERAAHHALAVNPLIGIRRKEVLGAATTLLGHLARHPGMVSGQYAKLLAEYARIAAGRSKLAPEPGDRRFADPAWSGNALFQRLLQSYLALGKTLDRCVDEAGMDGTNTERARFVTSLYVDAIAPTNFLAGNPAALKKLADTKGASVIRGLANFVEDVTSGRKLPKQVDARPFAVGKNLANTPGAVVYRNELLELIQYVPTTEQMHERPLLIVPPQINKYYVFDLTPAKSIVQWSLGTGVRTFVVSWRNPTKALADCGFDAYVTALDEAVDAMREITGSPDVNVWGACSGGITLTAFLAYLAARHKRKVHAATLAVCVLDTAAMRNTTAGLFVTPATIAAAKAASRKRGVVEGTDLARMFAWMRPNDLVWNYVVNNYLLGNDPPAHDILFWNNDTTRLPARLHADFLDLFESNPFARAGKLSIRGTKVDVGKIGIDTCVVGGLTDHITPWRGVYQTARLYGGSRSTFVLSNSGHVQSLINPPGNARSWFMAGPARAATPEAWLERQKKIEGSWWTHWRDWIRARSGALRPASAVLGSARHPSLGVAPGTYVLEH
jgi:polyhydroxyalkanoate synthase subunit PhaC